MVLALQVIKQKRKDVDMPVWESNQEKSADPYIVALLKFHGLRKNSTISEIFPISRQLLSRSNYSSKLDAIFLILGRRISPSEEICRNLERQPEEILSDVMTALNITPVSGSK